MATRDLTILELVRVPAEGEEVARLEGEVLLVDAEGTVLAPLTAGHRLLPGQTVSVAAGGRLALGERSLAGGTGGAAYAFVPPESFRASPSRADVPRLLAQLVQIEETIGHVSPDPLALQEGPRTAYELCLSEDFAEQNLVLAEARVLPEAAARQIGAVCLFFVDESAFVAMTEVTLPRIRRLMEVLGRPVNAHLVAPAVLEALWLRVYAPEA